jgi:hypothetical protein
MKLFRSLSTFVLLSSVTVVLGCNSEETATSTGVAGSGVAGGAAMPDSHTGGAEHGEAAKDAEDAMPAEDPAAPATDPATPAADPAVPATDPAALPAETTDPAAPAADPAATPEPTEPADPPADPAAPSPN